MSTYWGYYCKDCKKESDHWVNHGQQQLHECFKFYTLFHQYDFKQISFLSHSWPNYEIEEFLDEHRGHNICLKNEYGGEEEIQDIPLKEDTTS